MPYARARAPFAIERNGAPVVIRPEDIYDADDELVRAYPDAFEIIRATAGDNVEQATAAPGELRKSRRAR